MPGTLARGAKKKASLSKVSESIGRILTQRREARTKGDVATTEELTKRLGWLVDLRDRVHAGDNAAIGDVLSGATG